MNYSILYRGPLKVCNYLCIYCPFIHELKPLRRSRHVSTHLQKDKNALNNFYNWLKNQNLGKQEKISVFFIPSGEILLFKYYRNLIRKLLLENFIAKIVVQTNLSVSLGDLIPLFDQKLRLWITYHPSKVNMDPFIEKLNHLLQYGIKFSVGAVGTKENLQSIQELRNNLNESIYLWINAANPSNNYYSKSDLNTIMEIDPLFKYELQIKHSFNEPCKTGQSVFFIDEYGNIRRCVLDNEILGTLENSTLSQISSKKPCKNFYCQCFIAYVHLVSLSLSDIYSGILERIPLSFDS